MESCGQILDKLTEIYALIGNIVENGLVAIALIFYVANLHIEPQTLGYLTTLNHGVMLAGLSLTELIKIYRTRNAIDTLDIVGRFQISLLNL